MNKLNQFIYKDNVKKIYYLAEKEYDNYYDVHDQIWHREDGPAYIEHYKDGTIEHEGYLINGKIHREDGPASVYYNNDGVIIKEFYWLDDKSYTKEGYKRELRKRNSKIGKELYE